MQIPPNIFCAAPSNIKPLDSTHALLEITAYWKVPSERKHEDEKAVNVQYAFTCAVQH